MLDGWKSLSSLSLNTEAFDVASFSRYIRCFKSRLKHLSISHFRDPLIERTNNGDTHAKFQGLLKSLSALSSLTHFSLDLTMTRYCDGLYAADVDLIFRSNPSIQNFTYYVPFDAYFATDPPKMHMNIFSATTTNNNTDDDVDGIMVDDEDLLSGGFWDSGDPMHFTDRCVFFSTRKSHQQFKAILKEIADTCIINNKKLQLNWIF